MNFKMIRLVKIFEVILFILSLSPCNSYVLGKEQQREPEIIRRSRLSSDE